MPEVDIGITDLLLPRGAELTQRVAWFVRLRWLAVAGTVVAVPLGKQVLHFELIAGWRILVLAACLFALNWSYVLILRMLRPRMEGATPRLRTVEIFVKVQVVFDLLILTAMLHYAGGIQNPFSFYYIFHVIIASILLTRRDAYEVAALALALYAGMVLLEHFDLVGFYPLTAAQKKPPNGLMAIAILATGTTLFIAVFMATTIMEHLREKEAELEKAWREVKHLEATKSRFLVLVSHEMRSPIVAIRSIIDAIRVAYKSSLGDKPAEMLERAGERADSLLALTKDLLTLARQESMEGKPMTTEVVDMLELTRKNVELFRSEAEEKSITVLEDYVNTPFGVRSDTESMNLVVSNLVSNAIRYTPTGGTVSISWECTGSRAILKVADTGIGIPEKEMQHIFKEFFRADNAKKFTASGTGMGLAITKHIVERSGGTISVDSQESKGSAFTVTLPAVTL